MSRPPDKTPGRGKLVTPPPRSCQQSGAEEGCPMGLEGLRRGGTQQGETAVARGTDQHKNPKSDIEIAQAAAMRPIVEVAHEKLGIPEEAVSPYGRYKAKISLDYIRSL